MTISSGLHLERRLLVDLRGSRSQFRASMTLRKTHETHLEATYPSVVDADVGEGLYE